jgi:hypothetical protein
LCTNIPSHPKTGSEAGVINHPRLQKARSAACGFVDRREMILNVRAKVM